MLHLSISQPDLLSHLLLLSQGLVDIRIIHKQDWSLFKHFAHDLVPIGTPPVLFYFGEVNGQNLVDIFRLAGLGGIHGHETLLVSVEMGLILLDQAVIISLVEQIRQ